MPVMAAIQSATVNAAELLRMSDELGQIARAFTLTSLRLGATRSKTSVCWRSSIW